MRNTLPPKYIRHVRDGADAPVNTPSHGDDANQGVGDAHHQNHNRSGVRVLAAGIDTIYASVREALDVDRLADALTMRSRAADSDDAVPWELHGAGRTFLVQPHGQRGYAVRLSAPSLDVWLGLEGESARPTMYVELRSVGIHMAGVEAAVEDAQRVVEWFCPSLQGQSSGAALTASRVDLYADVQGWAPRLDDDNRFVCRGRSVGNYDAETFSDANARSRRRTGRAFAGFTFGRGRVVARIYNKTLQMQAKGQDWQQAVWDKPVADQDVWRVEVQFRRAVLTDFRTGDDENINTVADTLDNRQALWKYGVGDWLTLRVPNGDTNRSRWPIDPAWQVIQSAAIGSPSSPLVRQRVQAASFDRLIQGMTGYVTSVVAHDFAEGVRTDVRRAVEHSDQDASGPVAAQVALTSLAPAMRAYLDRRHRDFVAVVADKRRKNHAV